MARPLGWSGLKQGTASQPIAQPPLSETVRQPPKRRKRQRIEGEKLRRGPRKYVYGPIDNVVKEVARRVTAHDTLTWFAAEIAERCKQQNIECPKAGQLKSHYRKTFMAALKRARKRIAVRKRAKK
jgi:hypothetical protein